LLLELQPKRGYRLRDEGFDPVTHAIALPRERELGLAYVKAFVAEIKAGGRGGDCTAFHEG
jgi:hypothetical protein